MLACESLLDGEAEGLTRKAVELALGGDVTALRLCLERILPPRKERAIKFDIPELSSGKDAATMLAALIGAVGDGQITVGEGAELGKLVAAYISALMAGELEARLAALESATNINTPKGPQR